MTASWPTVRAVLLALVLLANGIVALPFGPRVTKQSLSTAEAKGELEAWTGFASTLGLTRDQFEEALIVWSDRLVTVDETLTAPFRSFMKLTKTGQSWGLFAVPDADPMWFTVLGYDADGTEHLLYKRLHPEATFLAGPLNFRRVRGVYDMGSDKKALPPRYKNLAKWVADRAFEAHPDLVKVVIVQSETHTVLPHKEPDPKVIERHKIAFDREAE